MEKIIRTGAAWLAAALCLVMLAGCGLMGQQHQRGPLDVKRVTYVEYSGDTPHVNVWVLTYDHKIKLYSVDPDGNMNYDYLSGELPPEDYYTESEYEMSENDWTSIVNVLTRVNFMELVEELPYSEGTCDAGSYYIMVDTSDAVHRSGGYNAGNEEGSDHQRFSEAKGMVLNAIRNATH